MLHSNGNLATPQPANFADESSRQVEQIKHDLNKKLDDVVANHSELIQYTSDIQSFDEGPQQAEPGSNFGDWPPHAQ
jgi:hypothetical protein